jgi:ParB-like chromosome segregation protein Spo0J
MAKKANKKRVKKAVKKVVRKKIAKRGEAPSTGKPTRKISKKLLPNPKITVKEEFRDLLPRLSQVEYEALEKSICDEGLREPLLLWEGKGIIVDGHNRHKICKDNGLDYTAYEMHFENKEEVKLWILDNQASRRNMTTFQRIEATLHLKDAIAAEAKRNQQAGGGAVRQKVGKPGNEAKRTNKILGDKVGVSHEIIRKAEAILEKYHNGKIDEDVMNALRESKAKISKIYNLYCKGKKAKPDKDIAERSNSIIKSLNMQVARSFQQTEDCTSLYDSIIEWAKARKAGVAEPQE